MANKIIVDLERCVGCWTCSMACKVGNHLDDDDFRIVVRTHGSGAGIDRPQGVYPNLRMSWQPVYSTSCDLCAKRMLDGQPQFCVMDCPTKAIAFGDDEDPESGYSQALQRVKDKHYHIFEMPAFECTRKNVTYATRE
ncbi:MAG: 4Fe-4S dicluster domain-containing protein [Coriobacteriales bacterium]|jgi:Fe-S-cluster-containing dehydrogenase component